MKTKKICILAMGIALWVVFAAVLKIPLVGHLNTDLAYIVFGVYCVLFGWEASIVGVIGCMFESLIFSAWFPPDWMLGNLFIGISSGLILKRLKPDNNLKTNIISFIVVLISVFIGIGLIKTVVSVLLYGTPFAVKFAKDLVATVADFIPMYIGVLFGFMFKRRGLHKKGESENNSVPDSKEE